MDTSTHFRLRLAAPVTALLTLLLLSVSFGCAAPAAEPAERAADADAPFVVEAACGQCQFGLPGDSCDLAVRFDGHAWFVMGSAIDDHGDAHAADGFCNAVRRARVVGRVVGDRFVATHLELLPDEAP